MRKLCLRTFRLYLCENSQGLSFNINRVTKLKPDRIKTVGSSTFKRLCLTAVSSLTMDVALLSFCLMACKASFCWALCSLTLSKASCSYWTNKEFNVEFKSQILYGYEGQGVCISATIFIPLRVHLGTLS